MIHLWGESPSPQTSSGNNAASLQRDDACLAGVISHINFMLPQQSPCDLFFWYSTQASLWWGAKFTRVLWAGSPHQDCIHSDIHSVLALLAHPAGQTGYLCLVHCSHNSDMDWWGLCITGVWLTMQYVCFLEPGTRLILSIVACCPFCDFYFANAWEWGSQAGGL